MATIRKRSGKRGATYQVQIRRFGHPDQCRTFRDLKAARIWARQTEAAADRATLPDLSKLKTTTLRTIAERFRDEVCAKQRGGTDTVAITWLLRHGLCDKALSQIEVADFVVYRDNRLKSVAPATVNRELTAIRRMFTVARTQWGMPVTNPMVGLFLKGADKARDTRLSQQEEQRLLQAASGARNKLILPTIILALETAMRRSELLNVKWSHILWDEPALLIPDTKTDESRTIPLTPRAFAILQSLRTGPAGNAEWVLPLTRTALRLAFDRIRKNAGLRQVRFHDLRHEATSSFFEMGLSVPEVALITGHKNYKTLGRYTHPQRKLIAQKLRSVSALQ